MHQELSQSAKEAVYRIGVDVGGTFTDVVLVEEGTGQILTAKVPTVPADPSRGCIAGIDKALAAFGIQPGQLSFVVHGTTVATNTIIQGCGAAAGLLATEGFRDVLEIAYQTRPDLYHLDYAKPRPLVPRRHCLGIPGRIWPDGSIQVPLDEERVREAGRTLAAEGVEAIAVAYLHAYGNPLHEQRTREILAEACPGLPVVLSSEVSSEFREYPRTSTAVVNAVLLPRVGPYIDQLEQRLADRGIEPQLHIMTSSGGIASAAHAKRFPVHLIESGPAGGVIGAIFVAQASGFDNIVSLDMGGTTAKACLVSGGKPRIADQFEVGSQSVSSIMSPRGQGYPVLTPVIDLVEIGAGGGSIAELDPGGALAVGPRSAGADPGPACYSQGGTEPTVTDANLVLGRINPDFFLGGETKLDVELAREAVAKVAGPLGMEIVEAARAIIDIANAKMTGALHFISVEQGIDPREFVLVPSGGAGPLHVADIAKALGIRTVVIPPTPGLNSALGMLVTDLKNETVQTYMRRASASEAADVENRFRALSDSAREMLRNEGVAESRISISRQMDMCYFGQTFRLRIEVRDPFGEEASADAISAFHAEHKAAYGFNSPEEELQWVNLRVLGVGRIDRPEPRRLDHVRGEHRVGPKGQREANLGGSDAMAMVDLFDRTQMLAGHRIDGPAIIEQMDSTIFLPTGATVECDAQACLIMSLADAAG